MATKTNIKHIFLVLSGKGGVGKSSISTQLALTLVSSGFKVGLLDIDLCGPSIPRLLGLEQRSIHQSSAGWVPVYPDGAQMLAVMSIGFMLKDRNDPVIWRGPKKTAIIKQFIDDVLWGDLDYLVIDTPPGTSDEHISIVEKLVDRHPKAVIVTTPQAVSVVDVQKEIAFCRKVGIEIVGLVENMSGFMCPCCGEITNIFGEGGGKALAEDEKIPFIGRVPLDPIFTAQMDDGRSFIEKFKDAKSMTALQEYVAKLKQAPQ